MSQTFRQRYDSMQSWYQKCCLMEAYHIAMTHRHNGQWKVNDTAKYFNVSKGLVSENLRLADLSLTDDRIVKADTREQALMFIERRTYKRIKIENKENE